MTSNLKNLSLGILTLFLVLSALVPFTGNTLNAQGSSENTGITYECKTVKNGRTVYGECGWNDLILAVKKAINYATTLALSFSVVVIAMAGFRYMKSGDNSGERTKANQSLQKVVIGIFFILAAWIIVNLITSALLTSDVGELVPLGR